MRALLVSEPNLSLRVRGFDLVLYSGRDERERWARGRLPFDTVVVEDDKGFVTWSALRWLAEERATVMLLDFDGQPIATSVPRSAPAVSTRRLAQYRTFLDPTLRLAAAKKVVEAKLNSCLPPDQRKVVPPHIRTISDLLAFEAREAVVYWSERGITRDYPRARDGANARLNFVFALLESRVRAVVHRLGLDPTVGFLHEAQDGKSALVYDLMEPWRHLATDVALEMGPIIGKRGFYRTFAHGWRLKERGKEILKDEFARRWTRPDEDEVAGFALSLLGEKWKLTRDTSDFDQAHLASIRSTLTGT
jgi:CRISP-associated protein Cas1